MGQILSQPETEKHSEAASDRHLAYGLSCMQGWRINMEDAHTTILNVHEDENENGDASDDHAHKEHVAFFGVYDGHGGEKSAIFTGLRLHELVCDTPAFKKKDYVNALKNGFLLCDQAILQDFETRDDESGCAATAAIVTRTQIICGNAGDSRTVMSINGFAKALSYDHKPFNEGEKARITAGGGYVDVGRVNGNLALSRGIGDFIFKKNTALPAEEQIVTCYPDVISHDIDFDKDEFVVLACDGIWDCLSSQRCVECVRRGIFERKPFATICEEIMELCCAPTSDGSGIGCDNMSILIVALLDYEKNETLDQWYDKIIKKVDLHKDQMAAIRGQEEVTNAYLSVKYGPISPVYNELYKEIFGEDYNIGQHGSGDTRSKSNGYSMFGNKASRNGPRNTNNDEDTVEDCAERDKTSDEQNLDTGAISLQKLLSSNVITNENGVIYLDTSSAQSLLASFGMNANSADQDPDQDLAADEGIESEDNLVHKNHIEEIDEDKEVEEEEDSEAMS